MASRLAAIDNAALIAAAIEAAAAAEPAPAGNAGISMSGNAGSAASIWAAWGWQKHGIEGLFCDGGSNGQMASREFTAAV
ncbi:MAG: hypothetical protein CBB71_07205 [Rhodopirellula sp. TMED11]|nr:MAG: hypothetical protein CBB71_07205 [Rhodopirellula sp. TMED11]